MTHDHDHSDGHEHSHDDPADPVGGQGAARRQRSSGSSRRASSSRSRARTARRCTSRPEAFVEGVRLDLAENADNAPYLVGVGGLLLDGEHYDLAHAAVELALAADPASADALLLAGIVEAAWAGSTRRSSGSTRTSSRRPPRRSARRTGRTCCSGSAAPTRAQPRRGARCRSTRTTSARSRRWWRATTARPARSTRTKALAAEREGLGRAARGRRPRRRRSATTPPRSRTGSRPSRSAPTTPRSRTCSRSSARTGGSTSWSTIADEPLAPVRPRPEPALERRRRLRGGRPGRRGPDRVRVDRARPERRARRPRRGAGPSQRRLMRLVTWNVNSIKARYERVDELLDDARSPTSCSCRRRRSTRRTSRTWSWPRAATRPPTCRAAAGAVSRWWRRRACRSGDVVTGLEGEREPDQARWVEATVGDIRCVSTYVPNGQTVGSEAFESKLIFFAAAQRRIAELAAQGPLIVAGDMNVAPTDLDVWDPAAFVGSTHVTPVERRAHAAAARGGRAGRRLPRAASRRGPEAHTWWDYRAGAYHKRQGLRIDNVLLSAGLAAAGHGRLRRPHVSQGFEAVRPCAGRDRSRRRRPDPVYCGPGDHRLTDDGDSSPPSRPVNSAASPERAA